MCIRDSTLHIAASAGSSPKRLDSKPAATATPAQPRVETLEAALERAARLVEEKDAALAKMAEMELALAASHAKIQALQVQYNTA